VPSHHLAPFQVQFLTLHRGTRSGGKLEVALVPVDLEREGCPSVQGVSRDARVPYLDGIEYTIIANRSTAILAFCRLEVRHDLSL